MTDDLYRFSTALEVRWRDVDALDRVNTAVYGEKPEVAFRGGGEVQSYGLP